MYIYLLYIFVLCVWYLYKNKWQLCRVRVYYVWQSFRIIASIDIALKISIKIENPKS